jgi:protein-S-isoprenylcysteine O-methyltransferase Ste14
MPDLIIRICWAILSLFWLVNAFVAKPVQERTSITGRLAHRIPVLAGCWLFIFGRRQGLLHAIILPESAGSAWLGCAMCVMGLAVAIWARWRLGGNWSSGVTFKQGHELVERGPYRFVRHPIYSALLLMLLGVTVRLGDLCALVAFGLCFLGFWIKLREEEALMLRHFPDQYPGYRARVKALVPFVF